MKYTELKIWAKAMHTLHGDDIIFEDVDWGSMEPDTHEMIVYLLDNKDRHVDIYDDMCEADNIQDFAVDLTCNDKFMTELFTYVFEKEVQDERHQRNKPKS